MLERKIKYGSWGGGGDISDKIARECRFEKVIWGRLKKKKDPAMQMSQ